MPYEFCYIPRVMKKRRFLQALVAGGAVSLVSTRSLQTRLGDNRVLVTQRLCQWLSRLCSKAHLA